MRIRERGRSDGGEIRGSGRRRAKIKKRRREERRGRKPDELSSPRASVEDTRGKSASKLLLIIARTTRLFSPFLFPSVCHFSSPLFAPPPFFVAPLTLYLAASCCFDTERGQGETQEQKKREGRREVREMMRVDRVDSLKVTLLPLISSSSSCCARVFVDSSLVARGWIDKREKKRKKKEKGGRNN